MDEGHGSGNSSEVLGGDLEYLPVYRDARRSVFEDFAQRYHDLGAGNAQHTIFQRRALLGGVQVAFECFRIDYPDVGYAEFQNSLDFAIHPQRTVFRRENLNPE